MEAPRAPRGHDDKGSSTNDLLNEPKVWSDGSFSKDMLREENMSRLDKNKDLVHPVPYARYEPDKLYFYCSYSCSTFQMEILKLVHVKS